MAAMALLPAECRKLQSILTAAERKNVRLPYPDGGDYGGLNNVVNAGKTRDISISNCFAWQLAKANDYARLQGFAEFVSH